MQLYLGCLQHFNLFGCIFNTIFFFKNRKDSVSRLNISISSEQCDCTTVYKNQLPYLLVSMNCVFIKGQFRQFEGGFKCINCIRLKKLNNLKCLFSF